MRIAGAMITISALLFGLGFWAAWNVQRQQVLGSEMIAREVHGMIAAQDLYLDLREIRNHLQQYLRTQDQGQLVAVDQLSSRFNARMHHMSQLVRTERESEQLEIVNLGIQQFLQEYAALRSQSTSDQNSMNLDVGNLIDDVLSPRILDPARALVEQNRQVVDRTNQTNRQTTNQTRQAFLLLGVCGGGAGLVLGVGIARRISRSIVQLDVTIQGVAGHLYEVLGPVEVQRVGGLQELEVGLNELREHIATLVERLRQRELEVLRAEQLAALGQLAAGVAHELRNPLMPMKMLVQKALSRDEDGQLSGQALHIVAQEIGRLEEKIQEFLDFARPPTLEKEQVDLRDLIQQTCELISLRADRQRVEFRELLPSAPCCLQVDQTQMRQVVLNLLLNALDAQSDGGVVEIELSKQLSHPEDESAGPLVRNVVLSVRDEGSGISDEIMPRLFEPFVSSKESGTGLGLSICRRIVEAHGGQIVVRNRPVQGTEFLVTLPMT